MRWFGKLVTGLCLLLFSLLIAFLAIHSLFFTLVIQGNETMRTLTDSPWIHALTIGLLIAVAIWVTRKGWPRSEQVENRTLRIVAPFFAGPSLICVLVSKSLPIFDQQMCIEAAKALAAGDVEASLNGYYLNYFPFQLPWVLILSVVAKFGIDVSQFCQFGNIAANLLSVWALADCGAMLFPRRGMRLLIWLGAIAFLPLTFYLPFVYGNLPGLCLMLLGARALLGYIQDHRVKRLVISVVCFLAATLLKKNFLIASIAAALTLLLCLQPGKRVAASLTAALVLLVGSIWGGSLLCKIVGNATGTELSQGFPVSTFILLGLQEEEGREPGWYNDNGYILYEEAGKNAAATDALAWPLVRERIAQFAADPGLAVSFFYRKILSQWEEPSFQSLWVNEMARNPERDKLALSLYERGQAGNAALWWMNQYHSILLVGAGLWLLFERKNRTPGTLFFPLYVIGGFLFHLIWEAKGQYTLFYFYCLIPYAVAGYAAVARKVRILGRKSAPALTGYGQDTPTGLQAK